MLHQYTKTLLNDIVFSNGVGLFGNKGVSCLISFNESHGQVQFESRTIIASSIKTDPKFLRI